MRVVLACERGALVSVVIRSRYGVFLYRVAHLECYGLYALPVAVHGGTGGWGCLRRCLYGQSGGTDDYGIFAFGQTVIVGQFVLCAGGEGYQQRGGCGDK